MVLKWLSLCLSTELVVKMKATYLRSYRTQWDWEDFMENIKYRLGKIYRLYWEDVYENYVWENDKRILLFAGKVWDVLWGKWVRAA